VWILRAIQAAPKQARELEARTARERDAGETRLDRIKKAIEKLTKPIPTQEQRTGATVAANPIPNSNHTSDEPQRGKIRVRIEEAEEKSNKEAMNMAKKMIQAHTRFARYVAAIRTCE
jgi:hypothetical protein